MKRNRTQKIPLLRQQQLVPQSARFLFSMKHLWWKNMLRKKNKNWIKQKKENWGTATDKVNFIHKLEVLPLCSFWSQPSQETKIVFLVAHSVFLKLAVRWLLETPAPLVENPPDIFATAKEATAMQAPNITADWLCWIDSNFKPKDCLDLLVLLLCEFHVSAQGESKKNQNVNQKTKNERNENERKKKEMEKHEVKCAEKKRKKKKDFNCLFPPCCLKTGWRCSRVDFQ